MTKIKRFLDKVRQYLAAPHLLALQDLEKKRSYTINPSQVETQKLLALRYKDFAANGLSLISMREAGFQVFSQSDEDGILHFIFALIGVAEGKIVDIGSSNIRGSNSANLIINHGWFALLIDGNEALIQQAKQFYAIHPATRLYPPRLISSWVTADNVNTLISEHGFTGEIDLLSIDLDGVDYWIWKETSCIKPRVVVVEYQDIIGPDKSLTVPYRSDFDAKEYSANQGDAPNYAGASLPAFVKLGHQKGYRLVGCNRYGFNAFFVRNDLGQEYLPEISVASCFSHPLNHFGILERWPKVKNMDWVEV